MNAEEAVRLARLAAAAGLPKWVKLEIHPDPRYLLPDPDRDAQGRRNPRQGRLHRPALHQRRSRARQAPAGSRHRHRHAARLAHRLQPRHPDPRPDPHHHRAGHRAGRRRCRPRRAQPRRRSHGNGRRRRARQHRHRRASDPGRMAVAFKMAVEAGRAAFEVGLARRTMASPTSPLTAFLDEAQPRKSTLLPISMAD